MTALLCETELAAEQQTYAHAIDRSARTLLTLIDEILDFSKIEADKLQLNCAPFAVYDSVQAVVELLAPKAYEKGIDVGWAIDPSLPPVVLGDEVRLRQIVTNLLGNAIKFTDSGGVLVTVASAATPAAVNERITLSIVVEDTGIGIAPEALPTLFQEFEQADAVVRRRQGGAGLGLAISRRLARAMAGDIRVASVPGRGSIFTATLMLAPCHAPATTGQLTAARGVPHVLLALDGAMERRALRLTLEGAGIPVEEASRATALRVLEQARAAGEPFSTLLADARDGWEAAAQLLSTARAAAAERRVQAIVVLDTAAKAHFAQFRELGFDAYLIRPVRPQSVLGLIGACDLPRADATDAGRLDSGPLFTSVTGRPRVLLVEDNDINALLARRMLEKTGCEAHQCLNGREAVEAMEEVLAGAQPPYDLVLMDIHMPVMDGLEATRLISERLGGRGTERTTRPPIVALTANAFEEDRRRCMAAGMDDYLAKPFDREDLLRLLERWCRKGQNSLTALV
jgi:CheY-like chemotaxis protein